MPLNPRLGPTKPFARGQEVAVSTYPIRTPSPCLPPFLARSLARDLETRPDGCCHTRRSFPGPRRPWSFLLFGRHWPVHSVRIQGVAVAPPLAPDGSPPSDGQDFLRKTRHLSGTGHMPPNRRQNGTNRLRPNSADEPGVETRSPGPNGGRHWKGRARDSSLGTSRPLPPEPVRRPSAIMPAFHLRPFRRRTRSSPIRCLKHLSHHS